MQLGLLALGLKDLNLLLKPSVLILEVLLLQGYVVVILLKYFELMDLPVVFLPFEAPPLSFLAKAHYFALHDHLLLG